MRDWERLLGEIACLDQVPHDALQQFFGMLEVNFPTSVEGLALVEEA